jgi:hypothetical protein
VVQRVRLRRAGEQPARALYRRLEGVARDALDAVAREHAELLRALVRAPDVYASADPAVLPFRVLADADHVDVGRLAVGERRRHAFHEPHRPQVDVLVEPLTDGQNELPHGDVIGHGRIADGAEIDRIELLETVEPVVGHHPCVFPIEVAAPGELDELHLRAARGGRLLHDVDPRGDHFLADAVTGDDCYSGHSGSTLAGHRGGV